MNILMVIPARSGSRRLPNKNILSLGGRPIFEWSIIHGLRSMAGLTERGHKVDVCFSTDSDEYVRIATKEFDDIIGKSLHIVRRSGELAEDCDSGLVVRHAMKEMEKNTTYSSRGGPFTYDLCVLLQPTSPFRRADTVTEMVLAMIRTSAPSCLFSAIPPKENPLWLFREDGTTFLAIPPRYMSGVISQDLPPMIYPDGSVYVTRRETVLRGQIYGDAPLPGRYEKTRWNFVESLDIETQEDYDYATWLVDTGRVKL